MPSLAKISHVIYEHNEIVCLDNSNSHVHQVEFDCELQKSKIFPQTYNELNETVAIKILEAHKQSTNYYAFLSDFQKLPFALRGPPTTA